MKWTYFILTAEKQAVCSVIKGFYAFLWSIEKENYNIFIEVLAKGIALHWFCYLYQAQVSKEHKCTYIKAKWNIKFCSLTTWTTELVNYLNNFN